MTEQSPAVILWLIAGTTSRLQLRTNILLGYPIGLTVRERPPHKPAPAQGAVCDAAWNPVRVLIGLGATARIVWKTRKL